MQAIFIVTIWFVTTNTLMFRVVARFANPFIGQMSSTSRNSTTLTPGLNNNLKTDRQFLVLTNPEQSYWDQFVKLVSHFPYSTSIIFRWL